MSAAISDRGHELTDSARHLRAGPSWLTRLWAGRGDALIDRIDRGLETGAIHATLPDGTRRTLGGRAPGFEAEVHLRRWNGLLRVATAGSIGLYQGWEAGDWTSPDPVPLFALFMANGTALGNTARAQGPWRWLGRVLHALNRNSRAGAQRNIHAHYDLGNDFYAAWLDPELVYSSARFDSGANDLAAAQQVKLATITERLAGARSVLEIGCGWGALAQHLHAAGMAVTAISLSDEQLAWACDRRDPAIAFRKVDYRDVTGQFDSITSVEMVEAVGREYWPDFFDCIARCLKPGGRAAIQYIAIDEALFPGYAANSDFIQAYVFPGGMLVSEAEFRRLAAERGLEWRDQTCFGGDYAETLRLWRERFDAAVAEGRLPAGFDDRFVRLWRFYLMYCEGGFRGRGIDVRQVTLVKSL
ncbi:MAG: class I SAM-dependent methyltransferase [Novosphingobium sp.]